MVLADSYWRGLRGIYTEALQKPHNLGRIADIAAEVSDKWIEQIDKSDGKPIDVVHLN